MLMKDANFKRTEWIKSHREYNDFVAVLGEYDDKVDYVGPEGKKTLTKLIPRRLLLITDINVCAYIHDYRYKMCKEDENARLEADVEFLANMFYIISKHDFAIFTKVKFIKWIVNFHLGRLANVHAIYYYTTVRTFGSMFNKKD
jgi:hypothetical protein